MASRATGPGVPFPPPLLFIAGFLFGWWLDTRLEFLIHGTGAGPIQVGLGFVLVGAGFLLMLWGITTFVSARTAVMPMSPARAIVITGPYCFTRNPMYVGLTIAYVGIALLVNMAWPLVTLPAVLIALRLFVIAREERHLRHAFPDAYAAYCARVRRWL
ncbi:MAG TPA: isoprenylcysteine carboxylmethyltransferase family protein [Vicinamibacterales bacterium]|nr:isoprenylcysteine carboxylmethyltransferase family protein [Vicinamibacterales bacterium]